MKKIQCMSSKITQESLWLKLGSNRTWNEDPKYCSSIARTILTLDSDMWRLDILFNCCKFFSLAPRLNYGPNISNIDWNRLQTGEKWPLDVCCCWTELAQSAQSQAVAELMNNVAQLSRDLSRWTVRLSWAATLFDKVGDSWLSWLCVGSNLARSSWAAWSGVGQLN